MAAPVATVGQRAGAQQPAGRYIVVLRDGLPESASVASEHAGRYGVAVEQVYQHALQGYTAVLTAASVRRGGSAAQPMNATSHWRHGPKAAAVAPADRPHTAVGVATHQAASLS